MFAVAEQSSACEACFFFLFNGRVLPTRSLFARQEQSTGFFLRRETRTNVIDAVFCARHIDADRLEANDRTALFGQFVCSSPAKKRVKRRRRWRIESSRVPGGGRVAVTVEVENGPEGCVEVSSLAEGERRAERARVRGTSSPCDRQACRAWLERVGVENGFRCHH